MDIERHRRAKLLSRHMYNINRKIFRWKVLGPIPLAKWILPCPAASIARLHTGRCCLCGNARTCSQLCRRRVPIFLTSSQGMLCFVWSSFFRGWSRDPFLKLDAMVPGAEALGLPTSMWFFFFSRKNNISYHYFPPMSLLVLVWQLSSALPLKKKESCLAAHSKIHDETILYMDCVNQPKIIN